MAIELHADAHGNNSLLSLAVSITTTVAPCLIIATTTSNAQNINVNNPVFGDFAQLAEWTTAAIYNTLWWAEALVPLTNEPVTSTLATNGYHTMDVVAFTGYDEAQIFDGPAVNGAGRVSLSTTFPDTMLVGGYRFAAAATPQPAATWFAPPSDSAHYHLTTYKFYDVPLTDELVDSADDPQGGCAVAVRAAANGGPGPGVVINSLQGPNVGADLLNGTLQ